MSGRRLTHLLGTGLALAGVVWVLWQILGQGWSPPPGFESRRMVLPIALGAVLYTLITLLLAGGWWWLTGVYGRRSAPVATAAVWARTQIAKYIPGNVFHYVGRQALGRRLGLGHEALVASYLLELVSFLAAAAAIGVGGALAARSPAAAAVSLPLIAGVTVLGLFAWPFADATLRRFPWTAEKMAALPRLSVTGAVRLLLPALASHAAFVIAAGMLLLFLLRAMGGTSLGPADVLWVYPLAHVAGLLTPGAPGGLGVREAVLTLSLGEAIGSGNAAALALALRLVTILGDVLTFGLGMLVPVTEDGEPGAALLADRGAETDG